MIKMTKVKERLDIVEANEELANTIAECEKDIAKYELKEKEKKNHDDESMKEATALRENRRAEMNANLDKDKEIQRALEEDDEESVSDEEDNESLSVSESLPDEESVSDEEDNDDTSSCASAVPCACSFCACALDSTIGSTVASEAGSGSTCLTAGAAAGTCSVSASGSVTVSATGALSGSGSARSS
ncbi:hypothetical protein AGMMS49974_12100 [Deltaproteobacteria bacterium]|nr:hypothetical protein AGMMS49974_12100 [Deltaproteobacteria bacterium]